ncbi:helix-turn-helix domain-containing protein [Flavobacteriaceae bacterium]|nr:helix-turn-helix domain-containing protein [Flavobacteriaceae bacterium]
MYTAKIFGNCVKYIRTRLNVSQKELSDRIDMDDGSLRRIEAGRTNPTLSTICCISLGLRIPIYLFFLPSDKLMDYFDQPLD